MSDFRQALHEGYFDEEKEEEFPYEQQLSENYMPRPKKYICASGDTTDPKLFKDFLPTQNFFYTISQ